jgi:hypothetical protein
MSKHGRVGETLKIETINCHGENRLPRLGMAFYFMIITRNGRDGKKWSLVVVVVVVWWWCGGVMVVC